MEIEVALLKCANFGIVPGREPCITPEKIVTVEIPLTADQTRLIENAIRELTTAPRFNHCHLDIRFKNDDGTTMMLFKNTVSTTFPIERGRGHVKI